MMLSNLYCSLIELVLLEFLSVKVVNDNVIGEVASIHPSLLAFPSGEDVDSLIEIEGLVPLPL
jgi:hypothetical protein